MNGERENKALFYVKKVPQELMFCTYCMVRYHYTLFTDRAYLMDLSRHLYRKHASAYDCLSITWTSLKDTRIGTYCTVRTRASTKRHNYDGITTVPVPYVCELFNEDLALSLHSSNLKHRLSATIQVTQGFWTI